jgi:hypothetical protein
MVETVKQVASKAKGPAIAAGATAAGVAGVAGGIMLRNKTRRRSVLGVPVPRSISRPEIDVKSMAKSVGKASKQFGQTTKAVSKDIERVGDQAERIGKILD